jgi:hypothetical protein
VCVWGGGDPQTLLAGAAQPIDLADLRAHCQYGGGYTDDHPSVRLFWEVVETFGDADREALLLFVTSCSRPPLLGFRDLHPSFCIQKTSHPPEEADSRLAPPRAPSRVWAGSCAADGRLRRARIYCGHAFDGRHGRTPARV